MSHLPLSFEFFPPRDAAGREQLIGTVSAQLSAVDPAYFSVTYGAGGSTRDGTFQTVSALVGAGHSGFAHLSMGGDDRDGIVDLLRRYDELGVTGIVALRGDQPSGFGARKFANNAEALVRLIRGEFGDRFEIAVAAYPEIHPDAKSANDDLDFFERKVDAGANSAITQYFYSVDAFERFMERLAARNITVPVLPGIMPITNPTALIRFSEKCGAEIPRWLRYVLADLEGDDLIDYCADVVTRMCERLIALGVPGLHFYTLNRADVPLRVCRSLMGT